MGKITLTYSARRTYDCPFKYDLKYNKGIDRAVKPEALQIGSLYHKGREFGPDYVKKEFDKMRPMNQFDQDRLEIQRAIVLSMVTGAEQVFKDSTDIIREPQWKLSIINPDSGRISRSFVSEGKGDGLSKSERSITEEKTTSQIAKSQIDKLALDQQVLNEIINLERLYRFKVEVVKYRFAKKPSIKQTQKETVGQYCKRLSADYLERPEFYFHEEELFFSRDTIQDFERDLWAFTQILNFSYKHNYWPRNTSRCTEWGGCIYLPLCRGEAGEGMYIVKEPHEELREENNGNTAD